MWGFLLQLGVGEDSPSSKAALCSTWHSDSLVWGRCTLHGSDVGNQGTPHSSPRMTPEDMGTFLCQSPWPPSFKSSPPLINSVTLSKLLHFSVPQFPIWCIIIVSTPQGGCEDYSSPPLSTGRCSKTPSRCLKPHSVERCFFVCIYIYMYL